MQSPFRDGLAGIVLIVVVIPPAAAPSPSPDSVSRGIKGTKGTGINELILISFHSTYIHGRFERSFLYLCSYYK